MGELDYGLNFAHHSLLSKRAEIPIYSFAQHQRMQETTSIYSPHVLILEGIFALYDPRILELLDMKAIIIGPCIGIISLVLTRRRRFSVMRMRTHACPEDVSLDAY
jgi:uridine kinase